MSRENQIEEIKRTLYKAEGVLVVKDAARIVAEALYNANFRKQSEGEWRQSERSKYDYFCTVCGEKAVQNVYGNHDMLFKFCPNCGAKMKGGAE